MSSSSEVPAPKRVRICDVIAEIEEEKKTSDVSEEDEP